MIDKNLKLVFVGNRWNVLKNILDLPFEMVAIFTQTNSFLEKELHLRRIKHINLTSKSEFIDQLKKLDYDILVSNGCPYILPISELSNGKKIFINVHPSLLPDLRGGNPINGAILFDRPTGATCHHMDDSVDMGSIISRVKVDRSQDLDLGLLYQLCFIAEAEAFLMAYKRNFRPLSKSNRKTNTIYYTRKENDMLIDFNQKVPELVRKIKAFGIPSQGAFFKFKDKVFRIMDARILNNKFLNKRMRTYRNGEVVLKYDDNMVVKLNNRLIRFIGLTGELNLIDVGQNIINNNC